MTNAFLHTHTLLPIEDIARKLSLLPEEYETVGRYGAKIRLDLLDNPAFPVRGKLILVTATTPTTSGEGKTVVSIGLAQGLEHIGQKAILTSREPSLGPVFGMKGGAAGGGLSRVEPSQKINLHFHGDFHAITSAHNLLAAMVDTHLFFGNSLNLDPGQISWPRAMDMNDRALRRITVSVGAKGEGITRDSGFVITDATAGKKLSRLVRKMAVHNYVPHDANFGMGARNLPIVRIIEDPYGKNSAETLPIQMADVVAYFLHQRYRPASFIRSKRAQLYFDRLEPVLNKHAGRFNRLGIVVL